MRVYCIFPSPSPSVLNTNGNTFYTLLHTAAFPSQWVLEPVSMSARRNLLHFFVVTICISTVTCLNTTSRLFRVFCFCSDNTAVISCVGFFAPRVPVCLYSEFLQGEFRAQDPNRHCWGPVQPKRSSGWLFRSPGQHLPQLGWSGDSKDSV